MTTPDLDERNLADYLEILYRRRWTVAAVSVVAIGAAAAYAWLSAPVYRATTLVDIEKPTNVLEATAYEPPEEEYIPTQARLIGSESALRRVYAELGLARTEEFGGGIERFRQAVNVLPVPRTRLCAINVESRVPARAVSISRALAEDYLSRNADNQRFMARRVLADLDARARGPGARGVYESLPAVTSDPVVQQLKTEIAKAQAELGRLRATYTDRHPAIVAAKSQISLLQAAEDQEVARAVSSFRSELSGRFRPNNARVADPAVMPERPVRPRKHLALLLGLAAGLGLGCLAAMALETLDQTVRTRDDLEGTTGLALLGHVPQRRRRNGEPIYAPLIREDASSSSEAFRTLRTMVLFSRAASPETALLVTSAVQQEGKSFIATNLSVAFAQLGLRVLLIDGDLRRPSQHHLLERPAEKGLSDFLAGRAPDVADLVQSTDVPNLSMLASGPRPANPAELLTGVALAELVAWARERYDRVVIDCPPALPVSDILLWGRHVRSALLVSRAGRTRAAAIRLACARLRAGGIDILGGVINGTRPGGLDFGDSRHFDRYYRSIARETI